MSTEIDAFSERLLKVICLLRTWIKEHRRRRSGQDVLCWNVGGNVDWESLVTELDQMRRAGEK